ncbi:hypothetical protein [Dictyobacter aurantiacus]|uniref:hypothetical protein n=1 Tax=Dictyobacter aurantiacus TaxID=1936993 RepID=UPI000F820637|nr:hypothetical protein [Dictyobacter aurantiacus]
MSRFIRVSLLGTILLGVLVAWRRLTKPGAAKKTARHSISTSPDTVRDYWTADKMRQAQPATMPKVDALGQDKHHPKTPRS